MWAVLCWNLKDFIVKPEPKALFTVQVNKLY